MSYCTQLESLYLGSSSFEILTQSGDWHLINAERHQLLIQIYHLRKLLSLSLSNAQEKHWLNCFSRWDFADVSSKSTLGQWFLIR